MLRGDFESIEPVVTLLYLYGTPSDSGNIGLRNGDSVTYYDGVVAPNINTVYTDELKEEYPYELIVWNTLSYRYFFYALKAIEYTTNSGGTRMVKLTTGEYLRCTLSSDKKTWGELSVGTTDGSVQASSAKWASFDVLNEDESIAVIGTDPIPVGEVVDTINNIPIYEVIK